MGYRVAQKVGSNPAISGPAEAMPTPGAGKARRHDPGAMADTASDSVGLSAFAGRIAAAGRDSEAERTARVGQLESLYVSGHYQVDAEKVSRAIVDEALMAGAGYGEG
jgi:anti-sigma28 factor (negative regulator of flagellin synthesis)